MAQVQIKNSFNSIGEIDASIPPASLVLKLKVTDFTLRYFVISQTHQQIIFFGDYTLHHVNTAEELSARIEKIFEKDEILQLPFSKILIGADEKYSLVPSDLSFLINRNTQQTQPCGGAEIVFEIPELVLQTLKKLFRHAEILHLNSTYFHSLREFLNHSSEKLFVNISRTYFDVIFFDEKQKLRMMNRYEYRAASDFIYFILLCCEELKLDRDKIELVLAGEVEMQSEIYTLCYRYFRHIGFLAKPHTVNFSRAFDSFPKHVHFNLYNLHA